MKKRLALSRDNRVLQSAGRLWGLLATTLLALAPAAVGLAQIRPDLLRTATGVGSTPLSAAEIRGSVGTGGQGAGTAIVSAITTAQENGKVVVTVSTKGTVDYKAFTLSDPRRLVVDFMNADVNLAFRELPVNLSIVKQIRVRQVQSDHTKIARLVLDLEDVKRINHQIVTEGQTVKILIPANPEAGASTTTTAPAPGRAAAPKSAAPARKPASSPQPGLSTGTAAKEKSAGLKPAPVVGAQAKPSTPPKVGSTTRPEPLPTKTAAAPKPAPQPPAKPSAAAVKSTVPGQTAAQAKKEAPAPKSTAPRQATVIPPAASVDMTGLQKTAQEAKSKASLAQPPAKTIEVAEMPPEAARPKSVIDAEIQRQAAETAGRPGQPAQTLAPPAQKPPQPTVQVVPALPPTETRYGGAPLTLDLIDIPLVDFFRLMAEEGGINVVMDPEIRGTISIKVVKVPWDQILEAALANNGLDKQIEGNLVRIARRATLQQEAKQREDLKKATLLAADVETRVKRLNYAKAATFVNALTEQKSVRGTVVVDERSNSLVLTDIPSYLDKMTKLVESLDIPQQQVEIEARIVSANRDFARTLGVQFGFVQGNLQRVTVGGPNTFGTIGGSRPSATPSSTYVAGNPSTGRGASSSTSSASAGVSTGTSSQNAGNFNVNLPSTLAFGGVGVSIGNIFDTFLLDAAITAGENKGLAKLISQPKVTAQNNSSATITQGLRFPVQIIANNTVAVQFQNAALTLVVTPQITYEGNIIMDLSVENNTPDFSRQVNGIPSIRTSESKTRVLVGNGGTTVIGGIIIESDSNTSDRVPGLASLPGVGYLFKRTSLSRSSQEVLFFVTPKIIK